MKKNKLKEPFSFELDDKKLKEAQQLTPTEILRWLAQTNALLNKALTPEQKKNWQKIRKGKF